MLKQRVITAIILLITLLGFIFYAPTYLWWVFTGLITLLGLWEYSRIMKLDSKIIFVYILISIILGYLFFYSLRSQNTISFVFNNIYIVSVIFWLILAPLWMWQKFQLKNTLMIMTLGWLMFIPFWQNISLLQLNKGDLITVNVHLFVVLGMVWAADIGAYFTGKTIGKHKLAPAISPGKSIEGAIGGIIWVLILCLLLSQITTFYEGFFKYYSVTGIVIFVILLPIISIIGDLFESWLKRCANVKDSSNLLPGHGGVYDRIDSLIAVLAFYPLLNIIKIF